MDHQPPPFFKHGPSPRARFAFFALLSIVLLVVDAHRNYLDTLRQAVSVAISPLQRAANLPGALLGNIGDFFVTQARLQNDNARLRQQQLLQAAQLQRYQALQAENAYLRRLLSIRQRYGETAIPAEILYAGRDPFSRRIVVDKGTVHHVQAGQAVIDDTGVVGQVTRVSPLSSEITLLVDKEQAVPVQVMRNGLRAIAFGHGQDGMLELPFMPVNADIQNGDQLVTSGIDGTYPPGLPVAVVSRIERNAAFAFARIACLPSAGIDRHRQLLILAPMPEAKAAPSVAAAIPARAAEPAPVPGGTSVNRQGGN
jgi:rod shape-determining protein MreC